MEVAQERFLVFLSLVKKLYLLADRKDQEDIKK